MSLWPPNLPGLFFTRLSILAASLRVTRLKSCDLFPLELLIFCYLPPPEFFTLVYGRSSTYLLVWHHYTASLTFIALNWGGGRHGNAISGLRMRTVQTSHKTFSVRARFSIRFLLLHHWSPFPFFTLVSFFLLFVGKGHCFFSPNPQISWSGGKINRWVVLKHKQFTT